MLSIVLGACSAHGGGDAFLGNWESVKPSPLSPRFEITKEGQTYLLTDPTDAKFPATYDENAHTLNLSIAPLGAIKLSYVAATDHLLGFDDEFQRAKRTAASDLPKRSINEDAVVFGKKLYAERMIVCDGRTFAYLSTSSPGFTHLAELKTPRFTSDGNEADAGDKLNGVDYKGTIRLTWDAFRVFNKGKWTEWFGAGNSWVSLDIQGFEMIFVVHKQGQWQHDNYPGATDFLSGPKKPTACGTIPT